MLVVMQHGATRDQIDRVCRVIEDMGYQARPMPGAQRTAVGLVGNDGRVDSSRIEALPGVAQVIHVTKPYKQVSREWKHENTVVAIAPGVGFGGREIQVIAGPCAVESEHQIVTEALDEEGAHVVAEYADCIQVGARNMQNYSLLRAVGRIGKPVLLKRGMAATITDLLLSAEYILAEGNERVILCERGVRSFDTSTRNLLDLTAIPLGNVSRRRLRTECLGERGLHVANEQHRAHHRCHACCAPRHHGVCLTLWPIRRQLRRDGSRPSQRIGGLDAW